MTGLAQPCRRICMAQDLAQAQLVPGSRHGALDVIIMAQIQLVILLQDLNLLRLTAMASALVQNT